MLRLGSGQPVQRFQLLCLWGGVLGACSIIHIHHNLVFAIRRGSGQLWQVPLPFPYGSMFGIACLNEQINAVLLSAIRRDSGQPVQILKKKHCDVASDVGVNFKNVGVLSIESSLFHLLHYTFLQTKHQRKGY